MSRLRISLKKKLTFGTSAILIVVLAIIVFFVAFIKVPNNNAISYISKDKGAAAAASMDTLEEDFFVVTHIPTPESVRAVYMTSWVAGTPRIRNRLLKLIEETEINSIVIDVKDETGRIAFEVGDPFLQALGAQEIRIPNIKEFLDELHDRGVYIIARISVFQDPYMVGLRPDLAIKRESDGGVWEDRKGISWVDAGSREMWDYIVALGHETYKVGFDELNFDYVRFPSDGDMYDIEYPFSEGRERSVVMEEFFAHLSEQFAGTGVITSADLFGMTTTNPDDLNIGQILEKALPHFDFIAPMVYPSHYPPGFIGIADPNTDPYGVIKYSLDKAVARIIGVSTTTHPGIDPLVDSDKLRPWLQDFDYGGNYDTAEVKAQIQAVYDAGLDSWMLWSPSNVYTQTALEVAAQ